MVGHRGPYGKGYWGTIALQKLGAIKGSPEKNGGDCYSKTEQTVTVLMAQN